MYKIIKLKHKKTIKEIKPPKFKDKKEELRWLKTQKRKIDMIDIKCVYIQYKDIKYMMHSENRQLISLFLSINFDEIDNEEKCIAISKFKHGNDLLVYSIITSDWLVNIDTIKEKTTKELEIEIIELNKQIEELRNKDNSYQTNNKITLYEYKLSILTEELEKKNKNEKKLTIKN